MPSLTAYTPYETLAFFQSIAQQGVDASNFDEIATTLNTDKLIVESETYDDQRLTANALQELYNDLIRREKEAQSPKINGDTDSRSSNPRKRKLSTSPVPNGPVEESEQYLAQVLVDKLYARFREQVIQQIREDEEEYGKLQNQIQELEEKVENEEQTVTLAPSGHVAHPPDTNQEISIDSPSPLARLPANDTALSQPHSTSASDGKEQTPIASSTLGQQDARLPVVAVPEIHHTPVVPSQRSPSSTAAVPSIRSSNETPSRASQPAPNTPQHHSPGSFNRTLPPPSPQRPNYGPVQNQHGFSPGSPGRPIPAHAIPSVPTVPSMPQMPPPPPSDYSNQRKTSPASGSNRGSPMSLPPQHQYPGYPSYPPPPQWGHQMPPQHQYPPHSPYANQQFYTHSPGRHPPPPYHTPHQIPYQPYPHTAPIHYQGQPPAPPQGWHGQPYYGYPASANTTPVQQFQPRRSILRSSGSSTPWKRRPDKNINLRPPSPVRPDREISPLSDVESPSPKTVRENFAQGNIQSKQVKKEDFGSATQSGHAKRARTGSATPSGFEASRSQSIVSYTSDIPTEKPTRGRKRHSIKAEPPSTPAPVTSDADQSHRSSGRRGRPRNNTVTNRPDLQRTGTIGKRKRSMARDVSTTPIPASPSQQPPSAHHNLPVHDPSLLIVSKTFAKTAQLLLSEITSHKLAGIFAKPLNERDAPGYKSLVLRPQDLKSIRAAVSKGGKAALTAIEALETEMEDDEETPAKVTRSTESRSKEGFIGNGMYLVKKTEDMIPPKGIVTSGQLEMELVRMFANAIMFNPLPTKEIGFGRALRLRRNGGDIDPNPDGDNEIITSDEDSPTPEEGGIIADTREMFDDVMALVAKWRQLEDERVGVTEGAENVGKAGQSIRYSSISSAVNDEDHDMVDGVGTGGAVSTPNATTSSTGVGPNRKRRRIGEAQN